MNLKIGRIVLLFCLAVLSNSRDAAAGPDQSDVFPTVTDQAHSESDILLSPLLNAGADRITIIGEFHGTNEIPRFFGHLVEAAANSEDQIFVGLELPTDLQPALDEFLAGNGGAAAKNAFLAAASQFWIDREDQDGRSSRAMFALIETLRGLQQKTGGLQVIAFDTRSSSKTPGYLGPDEGAPGWGDRTMAEFIRRAWSDRSYDRGFILVGNVHAMRAQGTRAYPLMAMQLPADRIISLNATFDGGSAWVCNVNGCGVQPLAETAVSLNPPVIVLDPPNEFFDGEVRFGKVSASPPAAVQDKATH